MQNQNMQISPDGEIETENACKKLLEDMCMIRDELKSLKSLPDKLDAATDKLDTATGENNNKLEIISKELLKKIDNIESGLESLQTAFEAVFYRLDTMLQKIDNNTEGHLESPESLQSISDKVDITLQTIDNKIGTHIESLDSISEKLDTMLQKTDNINNSLESLQSASEKLDTMSEDISAIRIGINYLKKIFSL